MGDRFFARNRTDCRGVPGGVRSKCCDSRTQCHESCAIGSIAGCGGWKTGGALAAYPLAKSAIHEYARCLAAHTRHSGVRVNCVIPGNINTPRTRAVYGGDRAVPLPGLSPLEHVGKPEDIASLVHFLCSEGGRYISGQCIRVDGGEQLSPC